MNLFKQNLAKAAKASGPKDAENITAVTQDLLLLVLPYLSSVDATALFDLCLQSEVLESKDNGVQKRGYKILAKLVEGQKAIVDAEAVVQRLDGVVDGLAAAAKKVRRSTCWSHFVLILITAT